MKKLFLCAVLGTGLILAVYPAQAQQDALLELRTLVHTRAASTVEAWAVDVRSELLAQRPGSLEITLPDGQIHRALADKIEFRAPGDLFWTGHFEEGGRALLTLKAGIVVGLLFHGDEVYELTTSPKGQILERLDPTAFAPCAHEDTLTTAPYGGLDYLGEGEPPSPLAARADFIRLDVMTVYTPATRAAAGGTAQIQATAQNAIDISNTALTNSDAATRFNLVHTTEVSYTESGNIVADRNWLRNDPTVQALRNQHGADLVGMIVENGGGFCGVAFLMGHQHPSTFSENAYQVTARSCAVGNLTYAHEHGHNMGLQHDPANGAPPSQAIYPWSYGHFHNGVYRTVMSYSTQCSQGCVRVPYFSNPNIFYQGLPTGIANQRDNARTIRLVAPFTAQYRNKTCDQQVCD